MQGPGEEPIARRLRSKIKTSRHVDCDIETMINNGEEKNGMDANTTVEYTNGMEQKNPLKISLIIDNVFGFLDLANLKRCRLVCSQWNDLSIRFVEKIALVTIGSPEPESAVESRSFSSFNAFAATSKVTFQSFKFKSHPSYNSLWSLSAVEEFLKDQNVRELTLEKMRFEFLKFHSGLLTIDELIEETLTHLNISTKAQPYGNIVISMDKLKTIKSVALTHCRLDIKDNCQLAPAKFEMDRVVVFNAGTFVNRLLVNDILNFENLKELKLRNRIIWTIYDQCPVSSYLSINLDSDVCVDNLLLDAVKIHNFPEAKWRINKKLTLRNIPFDSPNKIQLTELDFGGSSINLQALPESIEKLTFDATREDVDIVCPGILTLPNLKHLELLSETQRAFPYQNLRFFRPCSNLSTIKLEARNNYTLRLLTTWIPPSVRNIFLNGKFRADGNTLNLQKLTIQNNRLGYVEGMLDRFKSEHLVLDFKALSVSKLQQLILLFIERPYKSVAIGSLKGNMRDFKRSRLPEFLGEKASYYYFQKRKMGRAVSEYEYKKMLEQQ